MSFSVSIVCNQTFADELGLKYKKKNLLKVEKINKAKEINAVVLFDGKIHLKSSIFNL